MIAFGGNVERLCETWSTIAGLDEQLGARQHAVREFLALYGWTNHEAWDAPDDFGDTPAIGARWHADDAPSIVALFLPNGTLERPAALEKRGLDLEPMTARLVSAVHDYGIHYAFITDLQSFYLYDTRIATLLMTADSPAGFVREFDDLLTDEQLRAGSLSDVRRQPRSFVARQLRTWQERCFELLHTEYRVEESAADVAIDRLLVLRYALDAGVLSRPGWDVAAPFASLISAHCARPIPGIGQAFADLCDATAKHWRAGLFEPVSKLESVLEEDAVSEQLLRECGLLSHAKLDPATVLESFNYGEAAEKARVRMIPEENPERIEFLSGQDAKTIDDAVIELDLDDEGYRSIPHWLDKLLACYTRVGATCAAQDSHAVTGEMDLFDWTALHDAQPSAVADPWSHVFEKGLRIKFRTARQFRTARLIMYLYIIERFAESGIRMSTFPQVEASFVSQASAARRAEQTPASGGMRNAL